MSDFEGIPAAGDQVVFEETEDTESERELEEATNGKWRFNGKHIYITWSKSKIDEKDVFHQKLLAILPAGVRLFGGRELHQDGTPHYHVVMSFLHKVNWQDAASKFSIEGDTNAIRFEKPKPRQKLSDFLKNTMPYCEKDGDTFGERLSLEGPLAEQKKRKWQDIVDERCEEKAWELLREVDPRAYMVNHAALEKAMGKKKPRFASATKERLCNDFRVPKLMELWMDKYVIQRDWEGRPKALVIVGDPMVGKSAWAESQGKPIVMNSAWCLNSILEVEDATHIVVNNVKPKAFGFAGQLYWRPVLGGQASFHARDFQQATRMLEWNLPCIWTCNFDNDPRKDKSVADYIRSVADVVEIRDRPGENGWSKLYIPGEGLSNEDEGPEWLEARLEANSFMDVGGVGEAVDISNDFGI